MLVATSFTSCKTLYTEDELRKDKAFGLLGEKVFTCFILNSELWHLLPFWNTSWDWSSRSYIFNAFSSSGPYLTPRPPFSLRCWFDMISALYRNEGSVNKTHEPAEAVSSASLAPGGCLQSSCSWGVLVLDTFFCFFQEGLKYKLCIIAFLWLNNTWKATYIIIEIQNEKHFSSTKSFWKVFSSQSMRF